MNNLINQDLISFDFFNKQELDRKRIANELHDTSIQDLTHIIHKIELANLFIDLDSNKAKLELASINEELRKIIKDIRNTIFDLRPMSVDDLGLIDSLRQYIGIIENRNNIKIESDINFIENYDENKKLDIYRIVQECLLNAIKHSEATLIEVVMKDNDQNLQICISDNGIGISASMDKYSVNNKKNEHYGLIILKERVSILNGKCYIYSSSEEGTKIEITIPR